MDVSDTSEDFWHLGGILALSKSPQELTRVLLWHVVLLIIGEPLPHPMDGQLRVELTRPEWGTVDPERLVLTALSASEQCNTGREPGHQLAVPLLSPEPAG